MAIRTIQVNLSADITNFQQNISRAGRQLHSMGSEMNNAMSRIRSDTQLLISQLGNSASAMSTMRIRSQGLTGQLQIQSAYVDRLQRDLNTARASFGSASTQVTNFELALSRAATQEQRMHNELRRLNQEMSVTGRMRTAGQNMQNLQGTGMEMAMGVTLPVTLAVKKGIDYNALMEELQISFATFTGDAEKAKNLIIDIQELAKNTNLESKDIAMQSKILMSYGLQLENVIPMISRLGDVAGGNAFKLESLSKAMGQTIGAGKLTAQNQNQFIDAGFNPFEEMSKKMAKEKGGKPEQYLQKLAELREANKISVKDVADAIVAATSKGGRFFENMLNQSKGFSGQMSTLRENIDITFGALTLPLFEYLRDTAIPSLNKITTAIANFASKNSEIATVGLVFLGVAASIGPALIGVSLMGRALTIAADGADILVRGYRALQIAMVRIQTMSLATASAIAATTISVLVLAASAYAIQDNWDIMPSYFSNLWESVKTGFIAFASLISVGMLKLGAVATSAIRATYGYAKDVVAKTFDLMAKIPKVGEKFIGIGDSIRNSGNPFEKWEIQADANVEDAKKQFIDLAGVYHEATAKMNKDQDKIKSSFTMDRLKEKFGIIKSEIDNAIKPPEIPEITGMNDTVIDDTKAKGKKLEDVMKDMVDKIRQQAKSFADAFNLFDNVSLEKVSGERLFVRLDSQVKAMSKWKDAISNLKARLGANSPLLQELISKGPSAAGQILGLQNLSDTRLAEYAGLYNQKSDIALGMAGPSVTSQFMQEKKLENIILNITGNTIATDNIDVIANKIIDKLKAAGVM